MVSPMLSLEQERAQVRTVGCLTMGRSCRQSNEGENATGNIYAEVDVCQFW
jgi:hypothetical protein